MHPATELELCLVLLPDDIRYCEAALDLRRKSSGPAIRSSELITAIRWLKAAQTQLAIGQRAAAHLARQGGSK